MRQKATARRRREERQQVGSLPHVHARGRLQQEEGHHRQAERPDGRRARRRVQRIKLGSVTPPASASASPRGTGSKGQPANQAHRPASAKRPQSGRRPSSVVLAPSAA